MNPDDSPDDDRAEIEEVEEVDDDFVRYEAFESQNRLWIKAVVPILQLRSYDAPLNPRLQYALDRLRIAACERLVRILSSDLPAIDA